MVMLKAIYKITNNINGKVYIGQSVHPDRRWIEHKSKSKNKADNYPIHLAINKYGSENFTFEILEWTENYNNSGVKGYVIYRAKAEDDKGVKRIKGVIRSLSSYSYTLSDAHIFLPAAGSRANDGSYYVGSYGHYWSLSLRTDKPDHSHDMFFKDEDGVDSNGDGLDFHRCLGQSVRAVIPGE